MAEGLSSISAVSSFPEEKQPPSGYPVSIFKKVPEPRYLCSHCKVVLKGALQTACGHCYCSECLAWIVRNNKNPVCQSCKAEDPGFPVTEESFLSVGKAFSDAALNKEILELSVRCGTPGCTWTGAVQTLEAHQSMCEHALVPRPIGCTRMVTHRKLAKNSTNAIVCSDGPQKVSSDEQHNPSAVSTDERCRFSRIGCLFQGNQEERGTHEKTAEGVHLILLLQHAKHLKATLSLTRSGVNACVKDSKVLNGVFFRLHLQGALETDSFSGLPLYEEDPGCQPLARRADGISLLESKLRVFENIASVLSKEMDASRQKIAAFRGQRGLDQDTIRGLELKIADLQRCLTQKDAALGRLQERLQLSEHASYDGVFVWKIMDVHRKCYEAMCGKVCSLQSPAFYTARYGYKMCLRIFLNGEGTNRGSHVSLFLVLLKGDYDALLQWPFAQKITFMLLDQNGAEHLVNSFLADPSSASFQRPVTDMNEPSGCPRFLPLAKLRSPKYAYIKEGALFLKCIVEASL
ncbi:TNF receptor-associated factor 1 [Tiliqua scincoides]|uniref:TNF receptor-associated factor 1 n=1 Tax=Tiliqua scincoides TaxID=71010 RepID=UPI0034625C13